MVSTSPPHKDPDKVRIERFCCPLQVKFGSTHLQTEDHVRQEPEMLGVSPTPDILDKRASVLLRLLEYRIFVMNSAPGLSPSIRSGLRTSICNIRHENSLKAQRTKLITPIGLWPEIFVIVKNSDGCAPLYRSKIV